MDREDYPWILWRGESRVDTLEVVVRTERRRAQCVAFPSGVLVPIHQCTKRPSTFHVALCVGLEACAGCGFRAQSWLDRHAWVCGVASLLLMRNLTWVARPASHLESCLGLRADQQAYLGRQSRIGEILGRTIQRGHATSELTDDRLPGMGHGKSRSGRSSASLETARPSSK